MTTRPEIVIVTPCPVHEPEGCLCSTQVVVNGEIEIPPQKPEFERIVEFRVSVAVTDCEKIATPLGPKMIVSGTVTIGVEYVADRPSQPMHFAHFDLPFHTYLLCEGVCPTLDLCCFACIEHADFTVIDHRKIRKMVVLYVCARPCVA